MISKKLREPVNALTHLIGAGVSIILSILMFVKIAIIGITPRLLISVIAFSFGLIALYSTSGFYHSIFTTEKKLEFWKKMDHTMIFFLIAGTYTPFCLLGLPSNIGLPLLAATWTIAIIGSLMMIFWINMPRWLNTTLYIALGWIGVTCFYPMYIYLPRPCFYLIILGGIFYTIGGVMYGIKKPNISNSLGFHEIFHIFVLLGSLTHFIAIYNYMLV